MADANKHTAEASGGSSPLRFTPFSSQIELPFYSALFSLKLEHDKLDDSARSVAGLYESRGEDPRDSSRMQIHGGALATTNLPLGSCRAEGIIRNFNTIEAFRLADKSAILQTAARQIWDAVKDGSIYEVPSLLASFTILSYADLKKYRFTYWFAFPALHSDPLWRREGAIKRFTPQESSALVERVGTWRYSTDNRQHGFFLAKKVRGSRVVTSPIDEPDEDLGFRWDVGSLRDFENGFFRDVDPEDQYVAFVDPSTFPENPSWPLRNLLVLIRQRYLLKKVQILCYRDTQARRDEARSIVMDLTMGHVDSMELAELPKVTGWERHSNGKLQARVAHLAEYMDPTRLADQAVDLNLKLMKWRIAPELDLDVMKNLSCLLLGAGTLGSYVARNLMGWGVRKITFVDNGSVSFSNPVRQPLFEFEDCLSGGAPKAPRAAEALKRIYPGVSAEGHVLSVPMLGHPITDEAKSKADFDKLQALIQAHDVVFLLMDTRESRWLPTVMGKAANKIVMTAAIGFDTFVVMRHGARRPEPSDKTLGCYFCNDVVAPSDSIKDQTLDQQCTVTRPGVAGMASAMLVELLTSVLQHPLRHHAPAPKQQRPGDATSYECDPANHPLGLVPHQIRGFLGMFQNMLIHGESYPFCSACSPPILDAYEKQGWEFVRQALSQKDYVTELSGLAEVQREAEKAAADIAWSDDEEEDDGDGEPVLIE